MGKKPRIVKINGNIVFYRLLQIALVAGICYLAVNGKEGWGWLVFALCLSM